MVNGFALRQKINILQKHIISHFTKPHAIINTNFLMIYDSRLQLERYVYELIQGLAISFIKSSGKCVIKTDAYKSTL